MNKAGVRRYFNILSRYFKEPCRIILTGAAAGTFYGRIRATMDIDFAIEFKTKSKAKKEKLWALFADAVKQATLRTGMAVQYAEDIDRWSMISFLDYKRQSHLFKRFDALEVRLMPPSFWSIGKFARYLSLDIRDLIDVLKATKAPLDEEMRILGKALRLSPRSSSSFLFRKHVEHFLSAHGFQIWGKTFDLRKAIALFHKAAGIKIQPD